MAIKGQANHGSGPLIFLLGKISTSNKPEKSLNAIKKHQSE